MEERETRWVELNRHEEHRQQQVKGEQCRDLGGQSKAWQIPGMMNAYMRAETRLGMNMQQATLVVCGLKVTPGCVVC